LTIRAGRLAVETGVFPLYEVTHGVYRLTIETPKLRPVQDYLKTQGRFRHLSGQNIADIQQRVEEEYAKIKEKVACSQRVNR
jgi:pyruvate ferredoxin oxidoreductase beta subunit